MAATFDEGVIKFDLDFERVDLAPVLGLAELIGWRSRLHQRGLVGQDPSRYEGFGYGNVSLRTTADHFLISGTQTGKLEPLPANQFAEVIQVDLPNNHIKARGLAKPSSEALTHAAVYRLHSDINCILHVHSPEIWRHADSLNLPCTPADTEYGTVQMAAAVAGIFSQAGTTTVGVFAMLGHGDGVIAFGPTTQLAGSALLEVLERAIAIEQTTQPTKD